MDSILKILHLEDLPSDAEIVERVLRKANFNFEKKVVNDKPGFIRALHEFQPDIILSDHSLPAFNSLEALKITRQEGILVPVILVTATVSEEYAVNVIKEGASDYILKDRLERLPNAVQNALEKSRMKRERRLADEALRSSEQKYKLLFEANPMPMWMVSLNSRSVIAVNKAATDHYGYTREEFLSMDTWLCRSGVWKHQKKNGDAIDVEVIAHDMIHDGEPAILILAIDITGKLKAQAELARQADIQRKLIAQTSIQVQEKEREQIGKELHDNINQILAASKLYLDLAVNTSSEEEVTAVLLKSYKNLDIAIEEIRKLSQSLVAPSLEGVTLDRALAGLVAALPNAAPLRLNLDTTGYSGDITDEDIKLTCYRIVQVQLSNIIKHAKAAQATIRLSKTDNLHLTIADNGIGFDPSKKSSGIGLRNIRNRASCFNGEVSLASAPGKGCTLSVTIPLRGE